MSRTRGRIWNLQGRRRCGGDIQIESENRQIGLGRRLQKWSFRSLQTGLWRITWSRANERSCLPSSRPSSSREEFHKKCLPDQQQYPVAAFEHIQYKSYF